LRKFPKVADIAHTSSLSGGKKKVMASERIIGKIGDRNATGLSTPENWFYQKGGGGKQLLAKGRTQLRPGEWEDQRHGLGPGEIKRTGGNIRWEGPNYPSRQKPSRP